MSDGLPLGREIILRNCEVTSNGHMTTAQTFPKYKLLQLLHMTPCTYALTKKNRPYWAAGDVDTPGSRLVGRSTRPCSQDSKFLRPGDQQRNVHRS